MFNLQSDDVIRRQSHGALAHIRAEGMSARLICYAVAAASSAFVMPALLALFCLGAVLAAELHERQKSRAVLAALNAQPPSLESLQGFLRAVLSTEVTVAVTIGVIWFYATPGVLALPLALTAAALIGIANASDRAAPTIIARQLPYLAVAAAMSVVGLVSHHGLDTAVAGVLPVFVLAGVTLWVSRLRVAESQLRLARDAEQDAERTKTATELEVKSQFIATVSHELRTSLNGVLGMAQTLLNTDLSAHQRQQAMVIAESGHSMNTLLNDILDYSKLEIGKLTIELQPEDLRQSIEHIAWLHGAVASEKGIELRVEVSPDVPARLMLDAVRVRQCLSNLVGNALKFTEKGSVEINVSSEPCPPSEDSVPCYRITVLVADTGIGIPTEQGKHLFQPYAQGDRSIARRFGGTGLGLSITRQLVEAMDGTVTFESEPGQGTVFRLSFKANAAAGDGAMHASEAVPLLADHKVLIADDIETNRVVMRLFLKPLGVDVREVGNGNAAIEALEATEFDAALLDINMPGVDGAELARRIRAGHLARPDLTLVAISSDSTVQSIDVSPQGFDAVVTKPIDPRKLQETLAQAIRDRTRNPKTNSNGTRDGSART